MHRELITQAARNKKDADALVKFASPRAADRPSEKTVKDILTRHIPASGEKPDILTFNVSGFSQNSIIKEAHFKVDTADGKEFHIVAYQPLTAKSKEDIAWEKENQFPRRFFRMFCDEITKQ